LVELGNQLIVRDEIGAADDQSHGAPIGSALGQQSRNVGQPFIQRLGVRDQIASGRGGQVHRGCHLGGGLLEPVDHRVLALLLGALGRGDPVPQQCRYRRHPSGHQHRLLPVRGLDLGHQGGRVEIMHRFEHSFDSRCRARQVHGRQGRLCTWTARAA
jgi:hypothetical protein